MQEQIKKHISLNIYLKKITSEIDRKEKWYNDKIAEKNPERYIRSEFKNYN
jgi:hypothetical protein